MHAARALEDRIRLEILPMNAEAERRLALHFGIEPDVRPVGWRGRGERLLRTCILFSAGTAILAGSVSWLA